MIIYMITNIKNGKVYVGQTSKTVNVRWSQHVHAAISLGSNTYLHKAIRKNSPSVWGISILEKFYSREELNIREIFWIKEARKLTETYNLSLDGSVTARPWTEEEKKTRYNPSKPEPVICINTGIFYPSVREAAKSLNLAGSSVSGVVLGTKDSIKGLVFEYLNEEKKKKAMIKKNLRKKNLKKRYSAGRPILDRDSGVEFSSIKKAAKYFQVSPSSIGRFLKDGFGKCNNLNLEYLEA